MKLFVIGHEDAVLGFSLIGVEGFSTDDPAAALDKLGEIVARGDVGVVLITPGLAGRLEEELRRLEADTAVPIVLQIPAPGEPLQRPPARGLVRRILRVGT